MFIRTSKIITQNFNFSYKKSAIAKSLIYKIISLKQKMFVIQRGCRFNGDVGCDFPNSSYLKMFYIVSTILILSVYLGN